MGKERGGMNANDFMSLIANQIKAAKESASVQAEDAGRKVGESFATGIEEGFESSSDSIAASSVKITKAFRDLARKLMNQKDVFNLSLGGKNINFDIDFSDIDTKADSFRKRINAIFQDMKLDSGIEISSKTTENHIKSMIGLFIKYSDKLATLQERMPRLKASGSIKNNAKEQLALIDGLKEMQRMMSQASDGYMTLPGMRLVDENKLRDIITMSDQMVKGTRQASRQRETHTYRIKQERQELMELNELLVKENELLREQAGLRRPVRTINDKTGIFRRKPAGTGMDGTPGADSIIPPINDSTPPLASESGELNKVADAANNAAESKKKFAEANKEAATSAANSAADLAAEAEALDQIGEKAKTAWSTTRSGVGANRLTDASDMLADFNLPTVYTGEQGQEAVQMFARLKGEIEALTGKPVTIDFISDVNDQGQLEAVGATLKYVNEEAGVTVKQFYDIKRNQDGVLVATQSHEKAILSASNAAKVFNTEMQKKLALEQIKTLKGQMGTLKLDLTEVKNAANAINDKASLDNFNLALKAAKEKAKQLKTELKGQNTLDTVASMERSLIAFPSRMEEIQRRLGTLTDVNGVEAVRDVLRTVTEEYQRFLHSDKADDKVGLFRSITSSLTWVNAEMRNLSGKNAEIKRQETEIEKQEIAKQRAVREEYINWWNTTLQQQSAEKSRTDALLKQEEAYSNWWNRALLEREQKEKAKDERVVEARRKKEQAYINWWEKALKTRDVATQKKAAAPYLNYGKTTATSAQRKLESTQGAIASLGVVNPQVLSQMDAYASKVKELQILRERFANDPNAAKDPALVKAFQKVSYEASVAQKSIKAIIDEEQRMMQMSEGQGFQPIELSSSQLSNLQNEMLNLANSTAQGRMEIKGWNDDNTKLYYTVTNSKGAIEEMTIAFGQGTQSLYQYRTATREIGTSMQQLFKSIRTKSKEILSFVIGGRSIYRIISMVRQGIQSVKEIDKALTELKKVTDETSETYEKFLQTASKTGARLGATVSAVVEATSTFAKLGYTIEQASSLAESAIVYKNVGDKIESTEDAANSIISTLKGFGMEASEAMGIVDRFNEVGNRFAITSQGIGEALRLSASALNEGKNSLDESIALITAANEVVNDPSSVGTALKTLTLRLRGSKTELEEMGEDVENMATTTSQLQAKLLALTGGKVDIMLDEKTFKNSTQILREMADAWEDMDDISRASALELMGGKRQANVLSALIQNFDTVEKVIETSANSAGSALRENERYLDSIQGKLDQFSNATQSMWNGVWGGDTLKNFIGFGTEIIKIIDDVGLLKLTLTGLFMFLTTKYLKLNWAHPIQAFKTMFGRTAVVSVQDMQQNLQRLKVAYDDAFAQWKADPTQATRQGLINAKRNLAEYEAELQRGTQATVALSEAQKNLRYAQSNLANYQGNDPKQLYKYQDAVKRAKQRVVDLEQAQQSAQNKGVTGWQKLGIKVNGFTQKVQSAVSAMFIMYAVSKIMDIIGEAWDALIETAEESKEAFDELSSNLTETKSKLDTLESQLSDIKDRISEINQITPLTFTDQEELLRLKAQSAELERQLDLTKTIQDQQAMKVNSSAIDVANKYANTGINTGKTAGENVGSKAGTGAAVGAGVGVATGVGSSIISAAGWGTTLGSWAGPVGVLIGALVGALVGGVIGAVVGGVESAAEETIGESLDNMKSEYERLQEEYNNARLAYRTDASEGNLEDFEEAQEAFNKYQGNMASYLSEMDSYYSQIKQNWDVATDAQKKEYMEWQDTMDTWAIQSNAEGAKSNAIARIFSDEATGNIAKARDEINKLKENLTKAKKSGEGVDDALAALENYKLNLSDKEVDRLREIGIYLYEIEDYFKEVIKTESEFIDSDLEEVANDINKITDGIDSLKTAFDEVIKEGILTAKTILSVKEALGIGDSTKETEELTDAWSEYLKVVMSGTATTEEALAATEKLTQAWLEDALANNSLVPETKMEFVAQLKVLGVENAEQYVDDLLQKNMVKDLENSMTPDKELVRDAYEEANQGTIGPSAFDSFDDAQIKELADLYGIASNVSEEARQDILKTYGIEEDAIQGIIDKLEEKSKLNAEIVAQQKKQEEYNAWYNGDGDTKGIRAWQQDVERAKLLLNGFNPDDWDARDLIFDDDDETTHYTNWSTGKTITIQEYDKLYKQYEKYLDIKEQYDALWAQGEEKGYIIDGKIVDPNFQSEIDELQDKINDIDDEIDKTLTLDVKLQLGLVDENQLVDDLQNVFDTLTNAVNEFNENGYLTVDTAQALTDSDNIDPKYLTLLKDENGQLSLTKEKLYQVAIARLTDLKIKRQDAILTDAETLAKNGSIEKLRESTEVLYGEADAMQKVNKERLETIRGILEERKAKGELVGFDINNYMTNLENQIDATGKIFDSAIANIENSFSAAGNTATQEADDAFKRAMDYWENRIAANQAKYEQLQNEIDLLDKKGQKADASYYEEQIKLENKRLSLLKQQKAEAKSFLGTFKEGSDEWWEVANTLNDIEGELDDVTASIVDLQDAIGEIDAYKFEEFGNRLDNLTSKLETIRNLMAPDGEEDWFDDNGDWTEAGIAVLGSQIQELELYKQGYQNTMDELAKYESPYAGNEESYVNLGIHSEQEYYDKVEELISQQYNYAESISDTEQAVVGMYESNIDAVEEYVDTLIDSYNDYIDSVKEALDAERELFDFKKNVQKQAKDIAELERRIASLSGSENAADIAERRKLEAQLYESRESLNDTYYDHAKDAQNEALDAEQEAYETAMTRMVENMRVSLEEATVDMAAFLDSVTIAVSMNADTVLAKYRETEVPLNEAITNPWKDAAEKAIQYGKDATNLMDVWKADGYFAEFKSNASTNLTSPWNSGVTAANAFKTGVNGVMDDVATKIATNVKTASGELSKLYQQIVDTEKRAVEADFTSGGNSNSNQAIQPVGSRYKVFASLDMGGKKLSASGVSDIESRAKSSAMLDLMGKYEAYQKSRGISESVYESSWLKTWKNRVKFTTESTYAKGTTGTKRDEWAITDEPQFGDELVLVPGKNGNLSFMRKGTGVVPADMTQKLWELAQIPTSELMNKNLTAIVPNITKNDFKNEFNFESLVHVDTVDSDTLPQLEKMVDKKIDDFSKALNYSLKRFTR